MGTRTTYTRTTFGLVTWMLVLSIVLACVDESAPTLENVLELHAAQNFARSIPLLEEMLDATPGDRKLNRLYGIALMSIGQPVPAIWPLEKAAEKSDAPLEDVLLLGRAHLAGGSPTDARGVADRLLERAPDLLEARNLRIEANLAVLKHEDALADIDFVLQHRPDDASALVNRANVLLLLERTEDAEEAIAEAREALAASSARTGWAARFCALEATFTFEKGDEGHAERSSESWKSCLDTYPTDALVVSSAVDFFESQQDGQLAMQALQRAAEEAPGNVDFHIALASRLAAAGRHDEAIQELTAATEQPGGLRAWGGLVEFYSQRKQWPEAQSAMKNYLELIRKPSQREFVHYADLLIRAGDLDAAEEAMKNVSAPEMVSLLQGRLLVVRGQPKQALAHLEEGIRLWPDNSVARQLAAEAWEELGNYEKALSEYVEAARVDPSNWEVMERLAVLYEPMKQTQPLTQLLQRHSLSHPDDPRPFRMLIEMSVWSGHPEIAKAALVKLATFPGQKEWVIAKRATLVGQTNANAAIALIEKSGLDLTDPSSAEVLAAYVENLSRVGRNDDAIASSRAAIQAHERFAPFHETHAAALEAAGNSASEVNRALERAIEIAPQRVPTLTALGAQAGKSGRIDDALAFYDRASEAAPDDPDPAWSAIELLAARSTGSGIDAELDARLERLVARHGYHPRASALLARRLALRGANLERARNLARRSVFFGGDAEALNTLGWINLERGAPQAAIPVLRRSLKLSPSSPTTQFLLGQALARSGDVDGARASLEAALASKGFPEEAEARAELARLGS